MDIHNHIKVSIHEVLDDYSRFLEKNGYMDCDWYSEEPTAIDRYLNNIKS